MITFLDHSLSMDCLRKIFIVRIIVQLLKITVIFGLHKQC
jgi:hypothetical protein